MHLLVRVFGCLNDSFRCVASATFFACIDDIGSVYTINLLSDPIEIQSASVAEAMSIEAISGVDGFFAVHSRFATVVIVAKSASAPFQLLNIDKASYLPYSWWCKKFYTLQVDAIAATLVAKNPMLLTSAGLKLTVFELATAKRVHVAELKDAGRASVSRLHMMPSGSKEDEFNIVTVGRDCRVDFIVCSSFGVFQLLAGLQVMKSRSLNVRWSRHEALSDISAVEMVDLPLSEAQANIETEFSAEGGRRMCEFSVDCSHTPKGLTFFPKACVLCL